ncbi:hypothetical protein ES703_20243 [subsurface metagenome]
MVDYSTLSIVFTGLSISIAAFYYIGTLRNANRMRELTLESQELTRKAQEHAVQTRQAQLFMQIYQDMISPEHFIGTNELYSMEWEDWDDYNRKYGSENNPENYALRFSTWSRISGVGLLVKAGLIDVGSVHDLMRTTILWQWEKFRDIIIRTREEWNMENFMEGFEFLANEMMKETESRGHSADVPESFARFVPKEKEDT